MNAADFKGTLSVKEATVEEISLSDEVVCDLCRSYVKMLTDLSTHLFELRDKASRECLVAEKGSTAIGIGSVKILMNMYLFDIVSELEIMLRDACFKDTVTKPLDKIHYGFKLWCQHTINTLDKLDYGIQCLYTERALSDALPGYDCKTYYLYEHVKYNLSKMGFDDYVKPWPLFINEAIYALKQSVVDLENDKFLINDEKVENV